jgi:hypothetical protein
MYEAIEHWKQYKQKQALAELDSLIKSLIAKNGTTKY